jgi:hypothetical protein
VTARPKTPKSAKAAAPTEAVTAVAARRTDAALHPATSLEVIVSRALDQELEWYFAYAEGALHREDVGILPSYAAVRVLATEPTDEACRARARELARTVRGCLHVIAGRHASVLRSAYTPRLWPRSVVKAWGNVASIAVRLAFANDPWPERSSRVGLEEAVATQLSKALSTKGNVPVARLRAQARGLLGKAIVAYARARALDGPSLSL